MSERLPGKPLAGKAVLITGGAKRIGRAIALTLAEAGANTCLTYRGSVAEAAETRKDLAALGVHATALFCDLDQPDSIQAAVDEAVRTFGRIDVLVNNAGAFASGALETLSFAEWDAMYSANTRGPFLMSQACFPHLKSSGGRIIHIGSLGGLEPWSTHAHYCTSKAALHMLSKTMAKAWAPEISVNCIAPGMIVQGEIGAGYQQFAARTPMKRNGTAADVAAAALFFATAPSFITGQILAVDGGLGL